MIICFGGLAALLLSLIPLVAIVPILLFIGLVIGAQAFQASPSRHAPAVILALVPNIAEWAKTQVDGALNAAGVSPAQLTPEVVAAMSKSGVLYEGMATTGGGAVLAAVFVIDRRFNWAAVYAFVAAGLAFFGFIHAGQLMINASPSVTLGYALVGVLFVYMAWKEYKISGKMDWSPIDNNEVSLHN
jgi:AGZA family xanthine/uracil permease-like MFS transporter